ncbi:MAG: alpha/beta hydrolase [Deltaproteobacteria bacterium]|nr:alpha/beta hydrolase [Deltaproteobacteria bacterium]
MSGKYALAPEFASQPRIPIPSSRLLLRVFNLLLRLQRRGFDWSDAVSVRTHSVRGQDGHTTPVFEIAPKDLSGTAPALIDYHGGGFFFSYAGLHLSCAERYAMQARCRVFFTDYRLSIDDPFPAALHDCYATLAWVHENANDLGVDPSRVAVIGDSAGGALAAGVAQMAFDRSEYPICAQILIYPVTDHETKTDSALAFTDTPMWKTASNRAMWRVYARDTEHARSGGSVPIPPYAAPIHRESFAGLPPALVEVAEFDPLRDEGMNYAKALEAEGVPVELREIRGAVHGYDLVEDSPTAEVAFKDRMVTIQRFFERS